MVWTSYLQKISFLLIALLLCLSSAIFAGNTGAGQGGIATNPLLDSGFSELSIDHSNLFATTTTNDARHYELYAMASDSSSAPGGTSYQKNGRSSLEKWHKYLGYGTVLLAGITAVTSSEEDTHESFAIATAAGALSTVATGFAAHRQRFDTDEGLFTKDNLHIALGTLGAAILTTAVVIADDGRESSHSGMGVTGGVLMTLGVIDIVW